MRRMDTLEQGLLDEGADDQFLFLLRSGLKAHHRRCQQTDNHKKYEKFCSRLLDTHELFSSREQLRVRVERDIGQ